MSSPFLKPLNLPDPKDAAERQSLERAAKLIQSDPDLRKWRDGYLTGLQNSMGLEVIELTLKAKSFDEMAEAKGMALARAKIGDFQAALIKMAASQ